MGKNGRKKWINIMILTAVLLFGLSVSALAEEPEIKTFELAGVSVAIPEEFKNIHGILEWGVVEADCYTPPTYIIRFIYDATSEEDYKVHSDKLLFQTTDFHSIIMIKTEEDQKTNTHREGSLKSKAISAF